MLKFKKIGSIEIIATQQAVVDRLREKVDSIYYMDNKHKWPDNNIEFSPRGKNLYGSVAYDEFYISGKKKVFRKSFDNIEIKGRLSTKLNSVVVDYDINTKSGGMWLLLITNIALVLMLLIIPSTTGLESEKMKGYLGIPVMLVLLNILTPIGLKKNLAQAERKLKEIITTP